MHRAIVSLCFIEVLITLMSASPQSYSMASRSYVSTAQVSSVKQQSGPANEASPASSVTAEKHSDYNYCPLYAFKGLDSMWLS